MAYESERRLAIEAVLKASRLCREVRDNLVADDTLAKQDKSPVTVADLGAQAVINAELMRTFPKDPVVAEEDAGYLRSSEGPELRGRVVQHVNALVPDLGEQDILSAIDHGGFEGGPTGRFWTLDPIDGTKGFLRGDQYAIALALIEDGQPVLGVLGCPNLPVDSGDPQGRQGCLFVAVAGEGVTMRPIGETSETAVAVTDISDPAQALFCESVESGHSSHGHAGRIAELLGMSAPPYRIDSQCKYAAVARGDASIYLRLPTRAGYEEKIWDHAAGWMIIKEAGGQVSDVRGKPLDFSIGRTLRDNIGIVATNSQLHDQVIAAVQKVLP